MSLKTFRQKGEKLISDEKEIINLFRKEIQSRLKEISVSSKSTGAGMQIGNLPGKPRITFEITERRVIMGLQFIAATSGYGHAGGLMFATESLANPNSDPGKVIDRLISAVEKIKEIVKLSDNADDFLHGRVDVNAARAKKIVKQEVEKMGISTSRMRFACWHGQIVATKRVDTSLDRRRFRWQRLCTFGVMCEIDGEYFLHNGDKDAKHARPIMEVVAEKIRASERHGNS